MKNILMRDKRGMSLGDMYPAVLTIVLIGIILGIGLYVLVQVSDKLAAGSPSAAQSVNTTITGLAGMSTWIAVIVVVIAAAVVLGIVISSFGKTKGV
jgi:type II secretory pathway component PulF